MIRGKIVEQLRLRHRNPTIASSPSCHAIHILIIVETMEIKTSGRIVNVFVELFYLLNGKIKIFFIPGKLSHSGQVGNIHVKIIGPQSHFMWCTSRKRTIWKFDLLVDDVISYSLQVI